MKRPRRHRVELEAIGRREATHDGRTSSRLALRLASLFIGALAVEIVVAVVAPSLRGLALVYAAYTAALVGVLGFAALRPSADRHVARISSGESKPSRRRTSSFSREEAATRTCVASGTGTAKPPNG